MTEDERDGVRLAITAFRESIGGGFTEIDSDLDAMAKGTFHAEADYPTVPDEDPPATKELRP